MSGTLFDDGAKRRVTTGRRLLLVIALSALVSCDRPLPKLPARKDTQPQIQATAVSIATTLQPARRTFTHTLFISGDLARSGDEVDTWRLFDVRQNRVTFVDEIARTYRIESFDSILQARRKAIAERQNALSPPVSVVHSNATVPVMGIPTTTLELQMGAYRRKLAIGEHPQIPPRLFALMEVSSIAPEQETASPQILETFAVVKGFPLTDYSELPYGREKLVADRKVVSVRTRNVLRSMFAVPPAFRDTTIAKRPPAKSLIR